MRTAGVTRMGRRVELALAGDVLDGLFGQAAIDGGVEGGLLLRRDGMIVGSEERGARDVEHVEEELGCLFACFGAQVGNFIELRDGAGQGRAESVGDGQK